jgi:hypothetical protein
MAILIRSRKAVRPRPERTYLDPWDEEPAYYLLPPSGTLRDWSSPFQYQQSTTVDNRPASMLQQVTFNDDTVGDARVVRLRAVDEADNSW